MRAAEAPSSSRSASSPTCRDPNFVSARSKAAAQCCPRARSFASTRADGRGPERVFLPHAQIFEAVEPGHTLLLDDGKIRMSVLDKEFNVDRRHGVVGGILASRKGISLPDTVLPIGPSPKRTGRSRFRPASGGRLGGAVLRAARRGRQTRTPARRRPPPMSKIEKPAAISDLDSIIAIRRADGGPWRPRRGDAGRARARPTEADHQQGARRRQAGGGRHADARKYDRLAGADARRGVRRRHRRVRWRRRHHAVGRIRGWPISSRPSTRWTASPSR